MTGNTHAVLVRIERARSTDNADLMRDVLGEAAREIERLVGGLDDAHASCARMADLLSGVCDALKGRPDPRARVLYTFHDLPEVAARIVAERAQAIETRNAAQAEASRLALEKQALLESRP